MQKIAGSNCNKGLSHTFMHVMRLVSLCCILFLVIYLSDLISYTL